MLRGPLPAAGLLTLRDQALDAFDRGDLRAALAFADAGTAAIETAGPAGGADAAALLIARAEIEEGLDRFGAAAITIAAAIALLADGAARDGADPGEADGDGADDDVLVLWCQAQERLAGLERLSGDIESAAARLRAVLDRAARELGETSRTVVSAANALGVTHKSAADFDAAQACYERAMAAAERWDEPDPLVVAGLLHNLGGLAHSRGDAGRGIPLAERGVALRTEAAGEDHPDVARDLNALGALYQLAGRLDDAARAYDRALALFEASYGPDHYEVGMTCANLSVLADDRGTGPEAEALGRRSLRILEAVLGPDDAEVGLTLLNLGAVIAGQGRPAEAAELTIRGAEILTARLPGGHPHRAAAGQAVRSLGGPS
ncbi:MAG TPA: tetratricopeptide repeat protein [Streptosporangiaceae bacterium]